MKKLINNNIMNKKTIYANYDGDVWEVINDNKDGTVDLNIDDIQGDIMVCCVPIKDITFVDKAIYDERIKSLQDLLNTP